MTHPDILPVLFNPGQVCMTCGVAGLEIDPKPYLDRHVRGDWGDELCPEDMKANDDALRDGERLLSRYAVGKGISIYIITEWDRSATTVLLPEEY